MSRSFQPVPFTRVTIDDRFWAPRIRMNREATLAAEYEQCRTTGRIDALRLNWKPGQEPVPHVFWDSDIAKWLEAAAYSLATHPDAELEARVDEVVALLASAQQPDGYLNSHFSAVEPDKRWTNLRDKHELYCAGHLIEAAVAHFQATGKRTLLDVMCRYADHIDQQFGPRAGQKRGYCGHEEIELALVKLYRATGEKRYLDLSLYFIDERGRLPHYFDKEAVARGDDPAKFWAGGYEYNQAHLPVREQKEVVGHAVRAMYLYSAMVDLAAETGDATLLEACHTLWADLCHRRMYLTGGIGPSGQNEGFTAAYDLPNLTAYAETCAAIGLVFWAHRLLQMECDSEYADVMERALYNGVISGVSLDGTQFFYENPLASAGKHHREGWFECACCPPNLARLLASFGEYAYSEGPRGLAVHLYAAGSARTRVAGADVALYVRTDYPWSGRVEISVSPESEVEFALRLRIPGWCRAWALQVNGEAVTPAVERGYAVLERAWQPGDVVRLDLEMPVERMAAHPRVRDDFGRVALQRGPLVYCLEEVDHAVSVHQIALPPTAALAATHEPSLLGGVTILTGQALVIADQGWENTLYRPASAVAYRPTPLRAVPYYAWDNRLGGEMAVWLAEAR